MNLNFFKDVDTESFWLTCWSLVALTLVAIFSIVNYNLHLEDKIIADLVKQGHNKMELHCLYKGDESTACQTIANTKFQETIMGKANAEISKQ